MNRISEAARLMDRFARSSGLIGDRPAHRYLWTDAHAVCNYLALAAATGDDTYTRLAVTLVDQVHEVLGRHRGDDGRSGWISGLADSDGRKHPTAGGLRIGKPLPERRRDEPSDPRAEWDQDGQYYHYLTKWMHALLQVAAATGERRYLVWARKLAMAAYRGFRAPSGRARLFWKMSIDLSYPLVPSSGLHDPLDGLVTALTLRTGAEDEGVLEPIIAGLSAMCRGQSWVTDDPLGIGGLLFDAGRLAQLPPGVPGDVDPDLLATVLADAERGLESFSRSSDLAQPAAYRLAFRELGLSIGLQVPELIEPYDLPQPARAVVARLLNRRKLGISIERFWSVPRTHESATWTDHQDINTVMLATSLVPDGMLVL
ncbi:MAG: hypothetical protein AB7I04_00475 [Pseudomonadales bacterium]